MKTKTVHCMFAALVGLALTTQAATMTWDGGAADSSRWATAANWNPDVAPNAADDFVFTGNSISTLSAHFVANSLTGGGGSTLRVRSSGLSMTGALTVTGSSGSASFFRYVETGIKTPVFDVIGTTTVGGSDFRFLVDQADDDLTLNLDALTFNAGSLIQKQGSGNLFLNATSLNANGNTLTIDTGRVALGGTADYSGLNIDVTGVSGSGAFDIVNDVTVAGLEIVGDTIAAGIYAPGHAIYTTYSRLIDSGGTLTVIPEPATIGLIGFCAAGLLLARRLTM